MHKHLRCLIEQHKRIYNFKKLGIETIIIGKRKYYFDELDEILSYMISDAIDKYEDGNMKKSDIEDFKNIYFYWYGEKIN